MKSTILTLVSLLAFAYIGLCIYLYLFQRSFIYFPTPKVDDVPAEELWLKSGGEKLRIWRLHADRPDAIVYFGGNAEDVSLNIPEFSGYFSGRSVYLVNYRGYGGSTGSPTETALYNDAEVVFDYVNAHHGNISVVGRSLGSAVATHLAAVREIEKLVLVTPFDSFESLASAFYPLFPTSLLLKDTYNSADRADQIKVPVLILVAEYDEIVPQKSSQALVSAIDPSLVTTTVIRKTSHNSIGASPEYGRAMQGFVYEPTAD